MAVISEWLRRIGIGLMITGGLFLWLELNHRLPRKPAPAATAPPSQPARRTKGVW